MDKQSGPCQIVQAHPGIYLVWTAESVKTFREQARIIGSFVGCLPRAVFQNEQLSLPQMLMPEEVGVLLKFGFGKLEQLKHSHYTPTAAERLKFQVAQEKQLKEQSELFRAERMEEQLSQAKAIAQNRKAKLNKKKLFAHNEKPSAKDLKVKKSDINAVTVTQEEIEAVESELRETPMKKLTNDDLFLEAWLTSPLHSKDAYETVRFDFPKTDRDKLRMAVFEDLWAQKKYLTSGLKFGCDFLVYPGDPLKFHASHMVVCLEESKDVLPHELAAWTRVATQVKKTVLLCSLDKDGKVNYVSVTWSRTGS